MAMMGKEIFKLSELAYRLLQSKVYRACSPYHSTKQNTYFRTILRSQSLRNKRARFLSC